MRDAARDAFLFGPVWDLRRRVEVLTVLIAEDAGALPLAVAEQRRALGSTEAIAALNAVYAATAAIAVALTVAEEASAWAVEQPRILTGAHMTSAPPASSGARDSIDNGLAFHLFPRGGSLKTSEVPFKRLVALALVNVAGVLPVVLSHIPAWRPSSAPSGPALAPGPLR